MRVRDSKSLNTRILVELHDAVGYIQDPPKLKETVRTMYEKYGRFTGENMVIFNDGVSEIF